MKLKECPNCGNKKIWQVHGLVHNIWWCECFKCHTCGKQSKLRTLAKLFWNYMK